MNAIARRRVAGATALMIMLYLLQAVLFAPPAQAGHASCHGAEKYSEFTFNFVNGTTISGDNCPGGTYAFEDNGNHKDNEAWFPGTGGADAFPDGPGMQIHVSCSEVFTDGWANNGGQPDENVDTNWQIADYSIVKYSANGNDTADCGEEFVTTTVQESDSAIVVEKVVALGDDSVLFDFDGAFGGGLEHGESVTIPVLPGTHEVTEDLGIFDGEWETPVIECDDDDSSGSGATATYVVADGETVTCTFTNTAATRIVVEKIVAAGDVNSVFDFDGAFEDGLAHGESATVVVEPGTHTVTEDLENDSNQGWLPPEIVCDDDDSSGDGATATYEVAPGETVTCTFTNTEENPTNPTNPPTNPTNPPTNPTNPPTVAGTEVAGVTLVATCDVRGDFVAVFSLPGAEGRLDMNGDGVFGPTEVGLGSGTYVLTGATYAWDATPDAGHAFPPGTVTSGSGAVADIDSANCTEVLGTTVTTSPPDVAGTAVTTIPEVVAETLPFTGFETGESVKVGLLALLAGGLMLFAVRGPRDRDAAAPVTGGGWTNL